MDDATRLGRCQHCGAALPDGTDEELCPACRMATASGQSDQTGGEHVTALSPLSGSSAAPHLVQRLIVGQVFGPYRIGRLLGRGGMGEVYEAEHVEQGRRIALKILNQRLADPEDRARFLREGRLAASINHPNSVYIFGSEEILGTPVIAMELLSGGTLKDRVKDRGVLPPAEAVDAILQVTAGLDAANAAGILHRDVKPANCFVDRDGAVKVGDFGLSISSLARDVSHVTEVGTFQGTPQFASPEQMRGEPLDVRADIYSLGATLYYLLTGQPPFDDKNLTTLLTRIATEVPRSPRALQSKVPNGLAKIVLRCLSKDRADRPATYATLEEELRSFGSAAPTPATLARRFGAWLIDLCLIAIPVMAMTMSYMTAMLNGTHFPGWIPLLGVPGAILYYGILEGVWGATLGKWVVGLRVIGRDGQTPGLARGLWCAVLFTVPSMIVGVPIVIVGQQRLLLYNVEHPWATFAIGYGTYVLLAALFLTARRRNGFAGVHELLSGTRVIQRLNRSTRPALDAAEVAATAGSGVARHVGPYEIIGVIGSTDTGELLLGNDPNLRRRVWIHRAAPGAPAVPAIVRDLSRPTRLRWLSGRRTAGEAWDAYEALDGQPFLSAATQPQPWRRMKYWLLDLSREADAGLRDGSLPALARDRVWVTQDGRAKLLDFRAPGVPPSADASSPATVASAQEFLAAIARSTTPAQRLPLSAEAFIATLEHRAFSSSQQIVADVSGLIPRADEVTRWRRAVPVAICAVMPILIGLAGMAGMRMAQQLRTPETEELLTDLSQLTALSKKTGGDVESQRTALEVYVASRFGKTLTDEHTWANPMTVSLLGRYRPLAQRITSEHRQVSAEELTAATAILQPMLEKQRKHREEADPGNIPPSAMLAASAAITVVPMVACGLVWAFVFRGGLFLRLFGVAVVTTSGARASRLRAFWRALVSWAPLVAIGYELFLIADATIGDPPHRRPPSFVLLATCATLFLAGVLWTTLRPARGLQDYVAGTWLVPR